MVIKAQRGDKRVWAEKLMLAEGNKSKNLWSTVKRISGDSRQEAINCLSHKGITVTNKEEMANILNSHFVTKVQDLIKELPTQTEDLLTTLKNTPTPEGDQMNLMSLTEYQLNQNIKKMKKTASCGQDTITGKVISDIYESIKRVLLHGINLSLSLGIYPDRFKISKLIPLVKMKKDPLIAANYKPISNLSIIGKLYEEAMFDQTSKFIMASGQINKDQHGGRVSHSTTTCLVELWKRQKISLKQKTKLLF